MKRVVATVAVLLAAWSVGAAPAARSPRVSIGLMSAGQERLVVEVFGSGTGVIAFALRDATGRSFPAGRRRVRGRFRRTFRLSWPGGFGNGDFVLRACLRGRCSSRSGTRQGSGPAPSPSPSSTPTPSPSATATPSATPSPSGDHVPPSFAGLEWARTCVGGPIGGGRKTTYTLHWSAGSDDVTPSKALVYDVWQAQRPGSPDLSAPPRYASAPGAVELVTEEVPTEDTFVFVVRARDEAGNRDANKVEHEGQNLCD